jgi:UDP-N-acetylmuramoylalanine--D-glutamate ligase
MSKMKVAIIGYGVSGRAVEKLCDAQGCKSAVFDDNLSPEIPVQEDFAQFDLIVVSPGVPPYSQTYQAAVQSEVELISEMEFGFRHCSSPVIAITGTNGKTTTTELTVALLLALGYDARAVGNIGTPLSEAVAGQGDNTVFVAEVSSFQLEKIVTFKPIAAAVLNIASDHLDRYDNNIQSYAATKFAMLKKVIPEKRVIGISLQNDTDFTTPDHHPVPVVAADGVLLCRDRKLLALDALKLRGPHNTENIIASLQLIAAFAGEDKLFTPALLEALRAFSPGNHRLETIAVKDGVTYINDSKATNPHATLAALRAVSDGKNVRLLLGGLDKGMDFTELIPGMKLVKKAYILGECRETIASALQGEVDLQIYRSFDLAVMSASSEADPGDIVLLSPACASMDMFKNYAERGECFVKKINSLDSWKSRTSKSL